jgi:hypothetical protein
VTIDENELAHLGALLEELFPEYQRTLITIVSNPKGTGATNFARVEEYAYFLVRDSAGERIPRVPIGFAVPWEAKRDHRVGVKSRSEERAAPWASVLSLESQSG